MLKYLFWSELVKLVKLIKGERAGLIVQEITAGVFVPSVKKGESKVCDNYTTIFMEEGKLLIVGATSGGRTVIEITYDLL